MNTEGYIDFNREPDFNYVLQYIYESQPMREQYQLLLYRAALAMHGKPWKNLYEEKLRANIKKEHDPDLRKKIEEMCKDVPEGDDLTLAKSINNCAAQMSSGVDTYEYEINDPYMMIDDDTEDLMAAKCAQDYAESKLGNFASVFSKDLQVAGMAAVYISYDPVHNRNIVKRVNPKNTLVDTKYSSTGQERFRGINMMISWQKLKKMVMDNPNEEINLNIKAPDNSIVREPTADEKKNGRGGISPFIDKQAKYHNRKIRSLNGLDIYVQDINRLAGSWGLFEGAGVDFWEFYHDLTNCYASNYYKSMATTDEGRTNTNYQGDDVELTIIFDMIKGIEYKVINRRYVISANANSYHRYINFPSVNPVDGSTVDHLEEYHLGSPIIFQFEWENMMDDASYPISPVMNMLDTHDKLCELRAKREHVVDVLSILRVVSNAADAESIAHLLNIQGIVLDDIQGDINNVQFAYDWTAIDSQIAHYEQKIKEYLHGYSEFDAMQMMGDRASAAESGMAQGALAQGLAVHQNAIMELYAAIARQCIGNRVVYSPEQAFPVVSNGVKSSVTARQMALTATIRVQPKLAKTVHQRSLSTTALTMLGTVLNTGLVNEDGISFLMKTALMDVAPRSVVRSWVNEQGPSQQEQATAQLEAQNMANMLQQNAQAYQADPVSYEIDNVIANNSPEDVDAIIGELATQSGQGSEEMSMEQMLGMDNGEVVDDTMVQESGTQARPVDMFAQEGGMAVNGLEGMSSEMGAELANSNSVV